MPKKPRPENIPDAKTPMPYVEYRPTDEMRKVKCALIIAAQETLVDLKDVTQDDIPRLLDARRAELVLSRWDDESYRAWLLDGHESKTRIEYLFAKSLDAAEDILASTDPKIANARMQVIKVIAELGSKIKPRNAKEDKDDALTKFISSMDSGQLAGFLEKNGSTIKVAVQKQLKPKEVEDGQEEAE